MHKAFVTDEITARVRVTFTFLGDGGLSIEYYIKEISNLYGADIIVQIRIVILQAAKYRVEPLLGPPFTGVRWCGPGLVITVVLDYYACTLAI